MQRFRRGFTLVELLVVIGVIAVLIGLLIPAAQQVRESALRTQCSANLKQIMLAMQSYENVNKSLPMGLDSRIACAFVQTLPYLEQRPIFDLFDFQNGLIWTASPANVPWDPTPPNGAPQWGAEGRIPVFLCPSALPPSSTSSVLAYTAYGTSGVNYPAELKLPAGTVDYARYHFNLPNFPDPVARLGRSNYLLSAGYIAPSVDDYVGLFNYKKKVRFGQITDGASNVIAILENAGGYLNFGTPESAGWGSWPWAHAISISNFGTCPDQTNRNCNFSPTGKGYSIGLPSSMHGGRRINVAYADGSIRSIPPDVDFPLYVYLCGYRDGEIVSPE